MVANVQACPAKALGRPGSVYFLKDHLGSIRATVLDSATAPVIGYDDYDAWGYPLAQRTKPIPNAYLQGASKYKFTGNEFDDDFGLNLGYHIDRYYDHQVGRWWVVDPVQQESLSPYVYGANNPLIIVDPFGADTMYVYWPGGKRTAQYIADFITENNRPPKIPYYPTAEASTEGIDDPLVGEDVMLGVGVAKGIKIGTGVAASTLTKSTAKAVIGFAKGTAKSALTNPRRVQHAARHLIEEGILPNWNKATKQKFIELATEILENPTSTYDKVIQGGTAVKVFVGEVQGKTVEIWISKGGQIAAGEIATAVVKK